MSAVLQATIAPVSRSPEPPDADPCRRMRPEPGDTLVIDGAGMAGLPRLGTIIAVLGHDGAPPYLVRWIAGDYDSRVFPGPGARIERHSDR